MYRITGVRMTYGKYKIESIETDGDPYGVVSDKNITHGWVQEVSVQGDNLIAIIDDDGGIQEV